MSEVSSFSGDAGRSARGVWRQRLASEIRGMARDVVAIVLVSTVLALGSNQIRSDRIALVATTDFETVVPCPEPVGMADEVAANDPRVRAASSLLIDARSAEEYRNSHLPSAVSYPFNWLAEADEVKQQAQRVARDVTRSGKRAVVIYGDGGDPDSGQQWAMLLNSAGVRNVSYVKGGWKALGDSEPAKEQP